jgi:FdhE protein
MIDRWDARIRRAHALTSLYPSAAEALGFYARVAALQRSLYVEFEKRPGDPPGGPSMGALRDELDMAAILPKFPRFLMELERIAPPPLAHVAAELVRKGAEAWSRAIDDFWRSDGDANGDNTLLAERCTAWLFLQPFAESLSSRQDRVIEAGAPLRCPVCGARPIVGVLRPEGDGARKSLVCMLCAHEWIFRRVYCPACGEDREPRMAFYSATEIPHVRVDVCDTCHFYLKSVDLTRTGLAVPVVDEMATLSLDLWAREKGYRKLQMNMLGI